MDKAKLARCLKGIEASFTSNEARSDALAFAHRQLNIVFNAATTLCRIDPHDSIAVPREKLNWFISCGKRILNETSIHCTSGTTGSISGIGPHSRHWIGQRIGGGGDGDGDGDGGRKRDVDSTCETRRKLCQMRKKATIAFVLALSSHNVLTRGDGYVKHLLSQMDLRDLHGSSLVALIGSLHRSELFVDDIFSGLTEDLFGSVLNRSSALGKLTSRECSLLLWRRLAMAYMSLPFGDRHLRQLKLLLYQCHHKLQEELKFDFNHHLNRGDGDGNGDVDTVSDYMTVATSYQESLSSSSPGDRSLMRLQQTLSNISQAAIIMRQLDGGRKSSQHCLLGHLSLSSLTRLNGILELAQSLGARSTGTNRSSDTHTKVVLAIRDAIDQREGGDDDDDDDHPQCLYEQPVGLSSYTIDILLSTKGT